MHGIAVLAHGVAATLILIFIDQIESTLPVLLTAGLRVEKTSDVNFAWFVFAFELICFAAHATYWNKLKLNRPGDTILETLTQPIRWLEYSFSATAMIIAISALSLVLDAIVLTLVAVNTVVTMGLGYFLEELNVPIRDAVEKRDSATFTRLRSVQTNLFFFAWLPYLCAWIPSWVNFFTFIRRRPENVDGPPVFVYFVIFLQFALFSIFAYIQWWQQQRMDKAYQPALVNALKFKSAKDDAAKAYFEGETWYLRMSFLSKLVLAVTIFLGYLLPDAASDSDTGGDTGGESWINLVSNAVDVALEPGGGSLNFFETPKKI